MHVLSLILFILVVVLQAADAYLTWRIVGAGGSERNPIVAFLMLTLGIAPGLALAKLVLIALTWFYLLDHPILLLLVVVLYVVVVAHNLMQLRRASQA